MPIFPFGLTMGMMLSIPMLLAGLFLIWRGMREPLPPALPQEPPPAAPLTAKTAAKGADEPA
jgi:phosphatidylglycerol:prolipoprotein diacylglycerol transferase